MIIRNGKDLEAILDPAQKDFLDRGGTMALQSGITYYLIRKVDKEDANVAAEEIAKFIKA